MCCKFTISSTEGLAKQQNIVHFRSPIDLKSQNLTEFKSRNLHITHHTIHSHITYKFKVLQNIRENNNCFCKKKNIKSWTKFSVLQKKRKRKKNNKKKSTSRQMFFSYLFVICVCDFIHINKMSLFCPQRHYYH